MNTLDNCTVCFGANGGTPGNENWVDGILMCDYCHAAYKPTLASPIGILHKELTDEEVYQEFLKNGFQ